MVVRKGRHEVVAVVVVGLHAELDTLVVASLLGCLHKVFGQKLSLLVEVVSGTLMCFSKVVVDLDNSRHTTSMSISRGPFHCFTSSDASCSFHFCCWSSPKYPLNAFWPHGQLIGLAMGANAETDLYFPGFLRNWKQLSVPADAVSLLQTYQCQRAVASHAVTGDANSARVQLLEGRKESIGEFLGDVRVHVVALVPWLLGGVYVEARAGAKVVCLILALDLETP